MLLGNNRACVNGFGEDLSKSEFNPEFDIYFSPYCDLVRKLLNVLRSQSTHLANRFEANVLENMLIGLQAMFVIAICLVAIDLCK